MEFDYDEAFSRNLGLLSPDEQTTLRTSKVAIAGMGAVGGAHLTTLARMGIGAFHIADFDSFEVVNMNRQVGATVPTLGQPKVDVMRRIAADINPGAEVTCFGEGVNDDTVEDFLDGVDVAVDGLDYFAVDARVLFCRVARRRGIPVVAAGPLGCSAALLVYMPDGMSFDEYFAMDLARDEQDKLILFALGTAPRGLQFPYIDRRYVDLTTRRGPSLAAAIQLCTGVASAEVMKLLLNRGAVHAVPAYQQFDAYRSQFVRGKLRRGNRGPVQRLKLRAVRHWLSKSTRN